MYGVDFQSGSRNLSWKVWEIFVVVAERGANRKGRMGLRQDGRGQKKGEEEGAQPSFALGGTVSSTGENTFLSSSPINLGPEVTLCLGTQQHLAS